MAVPFALVVEDDQMLAEIFSLTLQTTGFETEWVADGAAAVARLADRVPDLVVLDLHLPHTSGPKILQQIRADERLAQVPVILATADHLLAQSLTDQANLVLLKPISPEQLGRLASRLIQRAQD